MKRLRGWEPQEVHDYQYAPDGKISRVIVTTEPEWDDDQRLLMSNLAEFEADHMVCGHYAPKALDVSLSRDVRHADIECLDCKAETDYLRTQVHARGHKGHVDECDTCRKWLEKHRLYIARHVPRT